MQLLEAPEFWVFVAFVIFVALVWRKALGFIGGALDARALRIKKQLEEAQALREEAQHLLAEYQRKQRDAVKEAEEILARAREEAERLRQESQAALEAAVRRRERMAMDKIAQAEAQALAEVRNRAVDLAVLATRRLLAEGLDGQRRAALLDAAIAEIERKLQ